MRLTSLSLATSAVLLSATFAHAESHATTMEAPAASSGEMVAAPAAGINGTYIVLGIFAALFFVSGMSEDKNKRKPEPR